MQMISGKDLAKLHLDLQMPALLSAILIKNTALINTDENALRAAFTELTPIETLMSLACSFQILAPHFGDERGLVQPLIAHAEEILDDYAPYWMRHNLPTTQEWHDFVADDLNMIGDFLSILSDAGLGFHPAMPCLLELLNEQAFLKTLGDFPLYTFDNVIRFPVERRI